RLSEQLARDSEIARLHAEEELKMMIEGLDRSNEMIAKHLQEYKQAAADLSIVEKIELINELVKHPIIDWETHSEGQREYWKIIRLGGHTAVYHFFVDMLKQFDREDLHQLWILVKETLSIKHATKDKEKELWVELKRLFLSLTLKIIYGLTIKPSYTIRWNGSYMTHVVFIMCLLRIKRYSCW
nr:hypothetical protein [Tanacetum cinerariifolium]